MTTPRIAPSDGPLYVVRWVRRDGRDAKHRYYRRRSDAESFRAKLAAAGGREAHLFRSATVWREAS